MWTVHVTTKGRRDEPAWVGPIEAVFSTEEAALSEAATRSRWVEVLAASVTRHTVDELGTRSGVALYVDGERQALPHFTNNHQHVIG